MTKPATRRVANPDTIRPDITAWELAKIMALHIDYTRHGIETMDPEHRALVERHSVEALE
jgi:hypothetical protein